MTRETVLDILGLSDKVELKLTYLAGTKDSVMESLRKSYEKAQTDPSDGHCWGSGETHRRGRNYFESSRSSELSLRLAQEIIENLPGYVNVSIESVILEGSKHYESVYTGSLKPSKSRMSKLAEDIKLKREEILKPRVQ